MTYKTHLSYRNLFKLSVASLMLSLGASACISREAHQTSKDDLLEFVDPFIGTGGHGHTFPGATRPNAMVQFSPDTHLLGWEASSGYHDSDSTIHAFSLTHLSGTGIGDLGDVAWLPYSGTTDSLPVGLMDKSSETASPGYYSVRLRNFGIGVELTSTERVGFMRASYENPRDRRLMLNLAHVLQPNWGHRVVKNDLSILSLDQIQGTHYTKGWAEDHQISYHARLSVPADSIILVCAGVPTKVEHFPLHLSDTANIQLRLYMPSGQEPILVKTGISGTGQEGAKLNLEQELSGWDFDATHQTSREAWRQVIESIRIESQDTSVLKNFYTALYHSHIAPYTDTDVDGKYRGIDKQIHQINPNEKAHYTVFSLWDTYRALHPLLTIINPNQALAYGQSLVEDYKVGTILPRWPLGSNYTGCMPAYHAVSVLADLSAKGLAPKEDLKLWAEAGVRSSIYRDDLARKFAGTRELDLITRHPYFKEKLGFVPADSIPESVSWAVEMAYDDWCIARLAEAAGDDATRKAYDERALYYKRYWDKEYKLMRPVMADGSWRTPFNPRFSAHMKSDYTEGNAYQWSFYAPHDMDGFIELMGGKAQLEANLDTLFSTSSRIDGAEQSGDITGLIGQYAHGNEPSHHIPYLYNWTDAPHRGQEMLDSILYTFYKPIPDGIIGNEDCGQMSAWYVLSALGFYQVTPGKAVYSIGRPLVDKATIRLASGGFTISVKNNSRRNRYVRSARINGRDITKSLTFAHEDIKAGGSLELEMGETPN